MNLHHIKNIFSRNQEGESMESEFDLNLTDAENGYENGKFLNSVEQLSEDDIELSPAAMAKKKTSDIPRKIIFFFFSAIFVVSCAMLIQNLMSKHKAMQIYNQLEAEFFSSGFNFDITSAELIDDGEVSRLSEDTEISTMTTMTENMEKLDAGEESGPAVEKKEYNKELEKMRAGLSSLAQINPDIYGWISIEGTQINYPIVQGEDNDYYLNHAYTGDYLPEGSIFVDYRNNESITKNYNTVFYGHNIMTGAMFHDVTKFSRDEYMNGVYIYIYTFDGVYIYEPFSFYESRYDYNYFKTGFTGSEDFIAFAEEMRDNSTVTKKDITFDKNDRIITLSTCTNGYYTQRYALHARLIKTITD